MRAAARLKAAKVDRMSGTDVEPVEAADEKKVYELKGAKAEKVLTPEASPT